jgi:RTX calcium-binding nonapeptide repeat (4 copies)
LAAFNGGAAATSGRAFVVYGTEEATTIHLRDIDQGIGGFAIYNDGIGPQNFGSSVNNAGDIDGDGLNDLLVGDSRAGSNPTSFDNDAGAAFALLSSRSYGIDGRVRVTQYGTLYDDNLAGTNANDSIVAGRGDDLLTANGGADVLYGGAGNDVIVISASSSTQLMQNLSASHARVDGGSGIDTLMLSGDNLSLDFTALAQSKVQNIEIIDLTAANNASVTINVGDVLDLASTNNSNNADGWADGTYDLAAGGAGGVNPERRHQLVIDGDAADSVSSSGWGLSVGTVTNSGDTYNVYNQGAYAQMLINSLITQTEVT